MSTGTALSVKQAAQAIRDGEISSVDLVRACLDRIVEFNDGIEAWVHIDPGFALAQAEEADRLRTAGRDLGPLHGVPVGIKDIIDTADLRTERGSEIFAGRQPDTDAVLVSALRQAGAVILGKTVTAEMAVLTPGKTKNPFDPTRTPGGSSSGSAAAVAAYMVPAAIGTQTNGSVIRPASYCGVYAYKPTFGMISRTGVLSQSAPLDTVGVFARSLEDLACVAEPMMVFDDRDPAMTPVAWPHLNAGVAAEPPAPPKFAFVRTPVWDQAEETTKDAFRELMDALNEDRAAVDLLDLPSNFNDAHENHRRIMEFDLARSYADAYETGKLSALLMQIIERGRLVTESEYADALVAAKVCAATLAQLGEDYDALITPSATGEAPLGLDATGSPTFCTLWTYTGAPALNLPLMEGPNGLPLGVQLVSHPGDDAALLRTARGLLNTLEIE